MDKLIYYFTVFIIYSFIGWLFEMVFCYITVKDKTNRGFLIGPYCPLYGVAALFITIFLKDINSPIILFIASALACTIIEYITSYILEYIFKTRWWDYSEYPLNLHGRIFIGYTLAFGFFSILIINITNPILNGILKHIIFLPYNVSVLLIFILFIIDIIISVSIIKKLKNQLKIIKNNKKKSFRENPMTEIRTLVAANIPAPKTVIKKIYKTIKKS